MTAGEVKCAASLHTAEQFKEIAKATQGRDNDRLKYIKRKSGGIEGAGTTALYGEPGGKRVSIGGVCIVTLMLISVVALKALRIG